MKQESFDIARMAHYTAVYAADIGVLFEGCAVTSATRSDEAHKLATEALMDFDAMFEDDIE